MKFTLVNESVREKCIAAITGLALDPVQVVTIREENKSRSSAQNSVYWTWVRELAKYRGETEKDIHHEMKEKFLTVIFRRDDPDYSDMFSAVESAFMLGARVEATKMKMFIIENTSTTKCNVKQFSEYLDNFDKEALRQGCYLTRPEDYYQAMGKKNDK